MTTTGTSTRHTHRQEGGPWFTDLSRQYAPPLQSSVQSTPRISSHSFLPRIRVGNATEQPQVQRPLDEWTRLQKSYSTSSLPLTPGQPHAALDSHNSPEFARVKPEPDADLSMPPLKLGWTYVTHHPHTWEVSPVRESQYSASTVRDSPGSSLLSHLHRPARDYTAPPPHGADGLAERDSTA
ncbi:hypothetical protein BJV74DRAFT_547476 [Russula compacta]|nr:hypothetical protein BJV74DRAFT_547476 [Russula compacta]